MERIFSFLLLTTLSAGLFTGCFLKKDDPAPAAAAATATPASTATSDWDTAETAGTLFTISGVSASHITATYTDTDNQKFYMQRDVTDDSADISFKVYCTSVGETLSFNGTSYPCSSGYATVVMDSDAAEGCTTATIAIFDAAGARPHGSLLVSKFFGTKSTLVSNTDWDICFDESAPTVTGTVNSSPITISAGSNWYGGNVSMTCADSGSGLASFYGGTSASATLTATSQTDVTCTDNLGQSVTHSMGVSTSGPTQTVSAAIILYSDDLTVAETIGTGVSVSGTGTITNTWTLLTKPTLSSKASGDITQVSATPATASIIFDTYGTYTFRLTSTDSTNNSSMATRTVYVVRKNLTNKWTLCPGDAGGDSCFADTSVTTRFLVHSGGANYYCLSWAGTATSFNNNSKYFELVADNAKCPTAVDANNYVVKYKKVPFDVEDQNDLTATLSTTGSYKKIEFVTSNSNRLRISEKVFDGTNTALVSATFVNTVQVVDAAADLANDPDKYKIVLVTSSIQMASPYTRDDTRLLSKIGDDASMSGVGMTIVGFDSAAPTTKPIIDFNCASNCAAATCSVEAFPYWSAGIRVNNSDWRYMYMAHFKVTGAYAGGSGTYMGAILQKGNTTTTKGNHIKDIQLYNNCDFGLTIENANYMTVENVDVATTKTNGYGVQILNATNALFKNVRVQNSVQYGFFISSLTDSTLNNIVVGNSGERGMACHNCDNNAFVNWLIVGSSNYGFEIKSGSDGNLFMNMTVTSNTTDNFWLDDSDTNAIANVLTFGNDPGYTGIYIGENTNGTNGNRLYNISTIASGAGGVKQAQDCDNNPIAKYFNSAHNGTYAFSNGWNTSGNDISGTFNFSDNGAACYDPSTANNWDDNCLPKAAGFTSATNTVNRDNIFRGKPASAVDYATMTSNQWISQLSGYVQSYKKNDAGDYPTAYGRWSAGNGILWDFSLNAADTIHLNRVLGASACPSAASDEGQYGSGPSYFLLTAVELDSNNYISGPCTTSSTKCLIVRNIGDYQGHGSLSSTVCAAGSNGGRDYSGITFYRYASNGYSDL